MYGGWTRRLGWWERVSETPKQPVVFTGDQKMDEFPFGDQARVTVWQGIGGNGQGDRWGAGVCDLSRHV